MDGQTPDTNSGASIYRVAVRLPPFWPERPSLWFAQAEAQFELAGVTIERTKFSHIISQLDHRYAAEVEDIITTPGDQPYKKLKEELIRGLSTSKEQRVRQLLTHEEMGDRKPSQFLRHLKSLAPDVPDDFMRSIWASRLPSYLQTILAGQSEGSLDAVSQLADRIYEVAPPPTVAAVEQPAAAHHPTPGTDNTYLLQRIEELSRQVAALSSNPPWSRRRSTSRGRSSQRHHSSHRRSDSSAEPICWYHRRFGENAQKCTQPCGFQQAENSSSSR